jgi:hypothetical protein
MGQVSIRRRSIEEKVLRRTTMLHHFLAHSSRTSLLAVSVGISLKKPSRSETDLATMAADIFEAEEDIVGAGWIDLG